MNCTYNVHVLVLSSKYMTAKEVNLYQKLPKLYMSVLNVSALKMVKMYCSLPCFV